MNMDDIGRIGPIPPVAKWCLICLPRLGHSIVNSWNSCAAYCLACLITTWMILGSISLASAAQIGSPSVEKPWSVDLRVKYNFNSHTSFEFGNPFSPYQSPLSRLEFPTNTFWVGAEVRRSFFSRFSLGVEALTNIPGDSSGVFKDSDWEDDENAKVKTTYSESKCRMERSYDVRGDLDLKIYDLIGFPSWFDIRPLIGVRWQRYNLMTHDGLQSYPAPGDNRPAQSLPGDGIYFEQTYWHYFLGVRSVYDIGKHIKEAARWKLLMQLDWAYVDGNNVDHHLLRSGNRLTYEKTRGDAWHALLGMKVGLTDSINANFIADYLRIKTTGSHRLINSAYDIDFSFDSGVMVWSEQMSITMNLEYMF